MGVRDCQAYVEPCEFNEQEEKGFYGDVPELAFGMMFHGFDYPDETGTDELGSRFWQPVMRKGILEFPRPEGCTVRRFIRKMAAKEFALDENMRPVEQEEAAL